MYRALLFTLILLSACKHSQDCPAFPAADAAWLAYGDNDTIKFRNAANSRITFVTSTKTIDPSYTEACNRGEPMGYYCKPCTAGAAISAQSDTMRGNYRGLRIEMLNVEGNRELSLIIYGHMVIFSYNYETHQVESADRLDTVTLGGTLYRDVYFHEIDTLNTAANLNRILAWKLYYNKQYGILGFEDRQTHSLFYRE